MVLRIYAKRDQDQQAAVYRVSARQKAFKPCLSNPLSVLQQMIGNRAFQGLLQAESMAPNHTMMKQWQKDEKDFGLVQAHPIKETHDIPKVQIQCAPGDDCRALRTRCYYNCAKKHLWRFPPSPSGFFTCKTKCCDWAYSNCLKDGTFPCVFKGI